MKNIIRIFTDGSAIRNPGPGGWGAVVIDGKKVREMSGAFPWSNISEMELVAAVEALRSTPPGSRVELYSDSELLIRGMRGFVFAGRARDGAIDAVSHSSTEIYGSSSSNSILF